MTEKDIIEFQVQRKFINLNKEFLDKLDGIHTYVKRLEKLLFDTGFQNFETSEYDFKKDRSLFLGKTNDSIRELSSQLELFDIKLRKE